MYLLIIFIVLKFLQIFSLQCKDDYNEPLDWFVVYKLPQLELNSPENNLINLGLAYTYATSNNFINWTLSKNPINSSSSIISNTLNVFYQNHSDLLYILYNDQPPDEPSKPQKGHNKGVILANNNGGIWLIHSVPHFPQIGTKFTYPKTGLKFGQSFLCVSLSIEMLNEIGIQLQYNEPQIYLKNIPLSLKTQIPQLEAAAFNKIVKIPPWYRKTIIKSINNVEFISFAKSKKFDKDLYGDLIAPSLENDLFVETWADGRGRMPSSCTRKFKVLNIKMVNNIGNMNFTTTHDHSKWAVSKPNEVQNWICIADINRMESQKLRGGGALCTNNTILAKIYQTIVGIMEKC